MSSLLVSIIIPAHRAARYLPETLGAIRDQTHSHWELLICEDGVFDQTAELVREFSKTTTNPVRLIQNQTNQGVSRARNALIDAATGTYLAFVDADDLWPPDYLQRALERLGASGADWQIAGARFIDESGVSMNQEMVPPAVSVEKIPTELLKQSFILPSAVVAHRRIFDQGLRFDPRFPIGEDLELWIRVIRAGFKPVIVREPLIRYRKHPTSATADPVRFPEEFSRVFELYVGDPIVDQRVCRNSIRTMLIMVARMTWRKNPSRALLALHRLFRIAPWYAPGWVFFLLAKFRQRIAS